MDILYSSTAYPPSVGGAQLLLHMTANALKERHKIQVVSQWQANRSDWLLGTTVAAPEVSNDYIVDGINVHRLGLSKKDKITLLPWVPIYYPFMAQALPAIADCLHKHILPYAKGSDLIHNMRIGREGFSYASLKAARHYDIPFVFTPVHHPRWVGWRYQEYLKLYRQADAVIALTPTEKKILIELGVSAERIHVTGTGATVAAQSFPQAFVKSHSINAPFVLFLGQHYAYKGYAQVLEAARLVWQTLPDINFVFVGPAVGNSEKTFNHFADRRIKRLGKVSLQEKTNALAACALLCVPSLQESFGSVYTEAWHFRKPVIGGNIPAIADVVSDGVDGYLVEQNSGDIANRIVELLNNSTKSESMGKAGKQKLEDRYTWQRLSTVLEEIYQSLL